MVISGATSALIAAFTFGVVFNAASAALFLNVKGHGSSVFRDGKRLVLVFFLLSAALWAQIDFVTTLIDPTGTQLCQVGIIFTTAFDQLARFSIEQFLLWVIFDGRKPSMGQYLVQGALAGRFALGAVFVGFSRPQFDTACVSLSSVFIIAVIVVAADAIILMALAGLVLSNGGMGKAQDGGQQTAGRVKAVTILLVGLGIWLATSVVMLLGISSIDYLFRTSLPASGLAILIVIVTAVSPSLVASDRSDRERRMPEAPSPRLITRARSYSTSASNDYYPPSRYEEIKAEQVNSMTAFVQPREVPMPGQSRAFAPPSTMAMDGQQRQQPPQQEKRSLFNSGKAPARAITVGKLAISNPVLQQGGTNPLDKVATMDLATAAQMERERRELLMMAAQESASGSSSRAIFPGVSPETGLARATTIKRKDTIASMSQLKEMDAAAANTTLAVASSTGAQLSPGRDELRRRSPKPSPRASSSSSSSVSSSASLSNTSSTMSRAPSPPLKSAARGLSSRQLSSTSSPLEPVAQPLQTPLQQHPTTGLPMNPRSASVRRTGAAAEDGGSGSARQETVMFVNNIIYNDPEFVTSVMDGAKDRGGATKAAVPAPLRLAIPAMSEKTLASKPLPRTTGSVVHRPRPIPRKTLDPEEDGIFSPPKGHRRSRSLGNMIQKSILQSNPGSPTALPPLPPPPQQPSSREDRPHPNDTKSMTFNEKVEFLFPTPKSAPMTDRYQRRSTSVPSNMMQATFLDDSPTLANSEGRDTLSRDSKRTTTSVRTRSIFGEQERGSQRGLSYATYQGFMGEDVGTEGGAEESPVEGREGGRGVSSSSMTYNGRRASSPVLPVFADIKSASTTMTFGETGTNMDSAYSPLPIQQIGLSVHQARAIEVLNPNRAPDNNNDRAMSAVTNSEEMTIMLDSSVAQEFQQSQAQDGPMSSPIDDGSPVEEMTSTRSSGIWHRRVGEETLSFSALSDRRSSRRGPPPHPLVLGDRPTQAKQASMVQAEELSPLPSPDEALKMIQAQLKKYEQADRGGTVVESPGRQALLNDLEAEMGMQETRWLGMQHEFSRDSLSTLGMSPTAESRRTSAAASVAPVTAAAEPSSVEMFLSRNSSTRSNAVSDWRALRRTRLASLIVSERSSVNSMEGVPPGSRATLWQKKLAEAHQEFMQTTRDLGGMMPSSSNSNRNFLTLSSQLGSPTPPDSDDSETEMARASGSDFVAALRARIQRDHLKAAKWYLWRAPEAPEVREGLMWVRPEKPYYVPVKEPSLPGLSVRPPRRRDNTALTIHSDHLWQKPVSDGTSLAWGLWGSVPISRAQEPEGEEPAELPSQPEEQEEQALSFYKPGIQRSRTFSNSRPLTQRPPRRSRRFTTLPDILEDPQPLPNKRDTLGIFQFPWGEKSDLPAVPPRPVFMAMPGTMSTGASSVRKMQELRSRQLEESEYSSSFFDDYDDEDERDDDSSSMGSESDDGFDETTLFEIATLLKTDDVPSTNSFFGSARDDIASNIDGRMVTDDYYNEERSGNAEHSDLVQGTLIGIEEGDDELQEMPSPLPPVKLERPASLWQASSSREEERGVHDKGLPQPEDWHTHDQTTETVRARPRLSAQPAAIASDSNLWAVPNLKINNASESQMWSLEPPSSSSEFSEVHTPEEVDDSPQTTLESSLPLWQWHPQTQRGESGVGLPHPRDWESYDIVKLTARAKPRRSEEPATIESIHLWTAAAPDLSRSPSQMWAPKATSAAATTKSTAPLVRQPSLMLWSAPVSPKHTSSSVALFDLGSGRTEFRTTTEAPAALVMERKPRSPARQPLDRLASMTLWTTSSSSGSTDRTERNWLASRSSHPTTSRQLLWSAAPATQESATSGLFNPKSGRSDFRTTVQPPAAIQVNRKPRLTETLPLTQLTSTAFWAANAVVAQPQRNWLFSTRSSSSSPKQLLWSAPPTAEDSSKPLGLFDTESGRSNFRTTAQDPAALHINRKPRSLERKPLEQLTSTTLWAACAEVEPARNWILPVGPVRREAKAVSVGQWQAALEEAIIASYPVRPAAAVAVASHKKSLQASPADWAAALTEAIAKSYHGVKPSFDASKRHPVFAATSLTSKASIIHPAATGYTGDVAIMHPVFFGSGAGKIAHPAVPVHKAIATSFDASKRHPVFAASSLTSKASVIHPAATGYTSDIAAVHPVFFGSGAGKMAHPAVPVKNGNDAALSSSSSLHVRTTSTQSVTTSFSPLSDVPSTSRPAQTTSPRGRKGGRITAMVSRFEDPSSRSQSASTSRESSVQPAASRVVVATPPRALTPEQLPEQQQQMDSELLAQIEALEQERLFAEQWATGSLDESSSSLPVQQQQQPWLAEQLAGGELFTPQEAVPSEASSLESVVLEARTYQPPLALKTQQEQLSSAIELAEKLFTPEDALPVNLPALERYDSDESVPSASSEPERVVALRDSLISVTPSEEVEKPRGSRIQFIY